MGEVDPLSLSVECALLAFTACCFVSCFVSKVNIGALLLISDCPLKEGGIKTKQSAKAVFRKFTDIHIELGIEAMADIAERGEAIRHYQW